MTTDKIGISRDVVSAIINSAYKYDTIADADRSPVCESLAWVLECPSGNSAAPRHRHGHEGLGYEMIPLLLAGIERSADPVKHRWLFIISLFLVEFVTVPPLKWLDDHLVIDEHGDQMRVAFDADPPHKILGTDLLPGESAQVV